MPTAIIKHIGDVEYEVTRLAPGVKGKAKIGVLEAPILISEQLEPGTKLDYVVAHEVGHRLTLDMIINAYEEMPSIFDESPTPEAGLIRYFMAHGLTAKDMEPKHPGTNHHLQAIFGENRRGEWTDSDTAREFIAEVYANWATGTGHIPEAIAKRFRMLTDSKNRILSLRHQEAAFIDVTDEKQYKTATLILGSIVAGVLLINLLGSRQFK